jgi:FkbM family methyltransferase
VAVSSFRNVVLYDLAASDEPKSVRMSIPMLGHGPNYYQAAVSTQGLPCQAVTIDSLGISSVAFVQIDIEGHEAFALRGMQQLLVRDRPIVLSENGGPEVTAMLAAMGYIPRRMVGSPNTLFVA